MLPILRLFHHRRGNETSRRALSLKTTDFDTIESMLQDPCAEPLCLPIDFLKAITRDFSSDQELGRGGHGVVYKGVLRNGKAIAVKKLSEMQLEDTRFHNEVTYLIGLKHQNIVQLVGYCAESRWEATQVSGKYVMAEIRKRLLCFEYVNNKSLDKYLSAESWGLEWHWRYDIIRGICSGLHYLHTECHIIHLDLKPENILLDDNMVPKITDFGMSRLFGQQQSRFVTESRGGTLGYMAPEYLTNGLISTKSDIFSFGVIIIELMTGSRDYPQSGAFGQFIENVAANWRNRLEKIHMYIPLEIYSQQVNKCIMIGLKCVDPDPKKRPSALDIIQMLDAIECTNRLTSELQMSMLSNICAATSSNPQMRFGPMFGRAFTSKTSNISSTLTVSGKRTRTTILAFEIANTVVKGSCLMKTLSKQNIQHVKEGVLRSKGVRLLISEDYRQLLPLVEADIREDLSQFCKELARFGNHCSGPRWHNLDRDLYRNRPQSEVTTRHKLQVAANRRMQILMTVAHFTTELCSELLALNKLYVTLEDPTMSKSIRSQFKNQRNVVKKLKRKSFWSKLMEEVLEKLEDIWQFMLLEVNTDFLNCGDQSVMPMSNLHQTLGPTGLALHYANVILQINTLYCHALASPAEVPGEARDALYQALPRSIRSKLRGRWPKEKTMLAEVRAEMDRTFRWLVPVAESTKQYYKNGAFGEWAMRGIEDVDLEDVLPFGADQRQIIVSPMLMHENGKVNKIETLYYANKERTEGYILDLVRALHCLVC